MLRLCHGGLVVVVVGLAAACGSDPEAATRRAPAPQELKLRAETVLPPGQSGFFSAEGQAAGSVSRDPADYGPHVDDQRLLYWSFGAKPGALGERPGTPETPRQGVAIYRDSYGVPIIHAGNARDLWFGVGYAVAQDRLFLMDAVRRTAAGSLAALIGCGAIAGDVQQRTLGYSEAEYEAMYQQLSAESQAMIEGYIEGANAWLGKVNTDPRRLPAEYALLNARPDPFTVKDVLAAGVYITRFVAAEGGNELENVRLLRQLAQAYGSQEEALKAFQDMVWQDDPKAVTSVAGKRFRNHPAQDEERAFRTMAQWALGLPETLERGSGTGHHPRTAECETLAGRPARPTGNVDPVPQATLMQQVDEALLQLRRRPTGASFGLALGPERTADGGTLLISAPQLGYSYPLLLVEYEVHSPDYAARGVSVPILPVVGIGYTEHAAWALTTGYSKTIDSFIETLCSTSQQAAGTCERNQYWHRGAWRAMSCRVERVRYRGSFQGLPSGTPALYTDVEVCRTVHGPVVARDEAAGLARSLSFAMFGRELETMEGIRNWAQARSFAEFHAAVAQVTWNENVLVATRDGHIAYYHPGLHPLRALGVDQRLPIPGDGRFDHQRMLGFDETPQSIDPPQGFLANWNNKPAHGWLDGEGLGATSRPGGAGQRVTNLIELATSRRDWRFEDLAHIDRDAGTRDPRAAAYVPVLVRLAAGTNLSEVERAVIARIQNWDRRHHELDLDPEDPTARDSVGATLFGYVVEALREELFGALREYPLGAAVPRSCAQPPTPNTVFSRLAGVGSHVFDQSVMDNLVLRVLAPETSGLSLRRDYAGGRSAPEVLQAALARAVARLAVDFNGAAPLSVSDLSRCRRLHPRSYLRSLTGVVGPGSDVPPGGRCVSMPYQDRGSWVHRAGYAAE